MKKKAPVIVPVLAALVLVVLGSGAFWAVNAYKSPLAPALDLPAPASKVAAAAVAVQTAAPKAPVQETCGASGALTVLFVGSDTSWGEPPYGADLVRLVKVDFDAHKVTSVAFPRDMLVKTAALNDPAVPEQHLGETFYLANQAAAGDPAAKNAAAANVLAQVLLENFDARAGHYLVLELDMVDEMVDALGGLEITVPGPVTTEYGVTFPAGKQTLNGELAAEYARYSISGDASRIERDDDFFKALLNVVTGKDILPRVPALLTQFKDAVVTDLSPEQLVSFSCLAEKVGQGSFKFDSLYKKPGLLDGDVPNVDAVRDYLLKILSE